MADFKIDEVIICINRDNNKLITIGKAYKVLEINSWDFVSITNDTNNRYSYPKDYFYRANSKQVAIFIMREFLLN